MVAEPVPTISPGTTLDHHPGELPTMTSKIVFAVGVACAACAFLLIDHFNVTPVAESLGTNLVTRKGKEVSTEDVREKDYVLLYFSASWCPPCRKFTPELVEFYDEHAETHNFEVILVPADQSEDENRRYMRDYGMDFPSVPFKDYGVRNKLQKLYGGKGIPHLVLLDRDGRVLSSSYEGGRYIGPRAVLGALQLEAGI